MGGKKRTKASSRLWRASYGESASSGMFEHIKSRCRYKLDVIYQILISNSRSKPFLTPKIKSWKDPSFWTEYFIARNICIFLSSLLNDLFKWIYSWVNYVIINLYESCGNTSLNEQRKKANPKLNIVLIIAPPRSIWTTSENIKFFFYLIIVIIINVYMLCICIHMLSYILVCVCVCMF